MNAMLENINWQTRELLLTDTKTNQERTVGLGHRLFNLLLPRQGEKGTILPRYNKDHITRTIMRHFKACGVPMRLHDTRHTYTTRMLDLDIPKRQVRTRTGHQDEAVFTKYDHPEATEIYEDKFDFMQEKTAPNLPVNGK
jgi:integrase